MGQLVSVLIAIALGVGGVMVLFWLLNRGTELLPETWEQRLKPYVFVGPALLVVGLFLLVPALLTLRNSFLDARSESFVGADNYQFLVTDPAMRTAIWNNLLWIIVVPAVSVAIGLAVAVLADKLKPRWENTSKSLIFLPMAISFVGASTIWGFVYAWRAPGTPQIGILNAIWQGLGGQPIAWLQSTAVNDFALMFIMIWLQAGFAMVLLSAAIKNVPEETLEAARIDGAKESQIFWRVVLPQIKSTVVVVGTTILILVLKVFDIVYVMTNGNYGTEVIANRFIKEMFTIGHFGRAAVIVVFLILVTIPFMVVNIRRFRAEEAMR
ncbi:MAG TPA: sugar ABC transporter permease [Egibacteraceae bacterium]|nr:sugar ABC transporter permease [Egibacteraceae bacterium]HVM14595.1 sugar ABC transporter permease [Egibacteraceae bacterium]HVM21414.1 sugar ABC transporter permease [Egibacteraceae bacterium]